MGAADGAAVPVSGVCASAAAHLGTERLFCCWWVETCQRFAPDRVILQRPSGFFPLGGQSAAQRRTRRRGTALVLLIKINTKYIF